DEVAEPTGDPMSHHGTSHRLAHDEPGARVTGPVATVEVDDEPGPAAAAAPPDGGTEIVPVREPGSGRQHRDGRIRP
ncbi:MAG: hypothetical protein QOF00_3889, partial [Pseudonocardiales bacterium]|nr:hypothetical protein [Pseudonocardiales bacterium]